MEGRQNHLGNSRLAGLGQYLPSLIKKDDVIAADSYQLCALLEFNIPGQPDVRYLAPWDRPTQFDVWNRSYDNLAGKKHPFRKRKATGAHKFGVDDHLRELFLC